MGVPFFLVPIVLPFYLFALILISPLWLLSKLAHAASNPHKRQRDDRDTITIVFHIKDSTKPR